MSTEQIICPLCGQADQVEKVSFIYLLGIGLNPEQLAARSGGQASIPARGGVTANADQGYLQALSRRLSPPSSGKQAPTRPLHPDMVVLTFSLVLLVFLYGIFTSQRPALIPVLAMVAIAYVLYFWKRKAIITKFDSQQAARQAAADRITRGVTRWMKLYYCGRDDGVFEPGQDEFTPADQMPGYLFRE